MGVLGGTTTVLYTSKNNKTGVTGITAKVRKPNGIYLGPYALAEVAEPGFEGHYLFSFSTTLADPEGDYVGVISSPNEGNHRASFTKLIAETGDSGPPQVVIPRDDVIWVDVEDLTEIMVQMEELPEVEVIINTNELDFVLTTVSEELSLTLNQIGDIDITIEEC